MPSGHSSVSEHHFVTTTCRRSFSLKGSVQRELRGVKNSTIRWVLVRTMALDIIFFVIASLHLVLPSVSGSIVQLIGTFRNKKGSAISNVTPVLLA